MENAFKTHFGTSPSHKFQSPLEKGDHPELGDTPLLDDEGMGKYQSLIGTLQWTITLGRFDIATAVMADYVRVSSSPTNRTLRTSKENLWISFKVQKCMYQSTYRQT